MPSESSLPITIRHASLAAIPETLLQRRRMYEDMHSTDATAIATAVTRVQIPSGTPSLFSQFREFLGKFAED